MGIQLVVLDQLRIAMIRILQVHHAELSSVEWLHYSVIGATLTEPHIVVFSRCLLVQC